MVTRHIWRTILGTMAVVVSAALLFHARSAAAQETPALEIAVQAQAEVVAPERRVALVIGNSAYSSVETLANPRNDAMLMRDKLEALDFEVFYGADLDLPEFNSLLDQFAEAAEGSAAALIYYSGHGFQLNGYNYLVPTDAKLLSKDAIAVETLRLDTIIARLQERNRQLLVFLDACRNNPLPLSQRTSSGLAQVTVGRDIFVAFATEPGDISYDGQGELSPFTKAVAKHIDTKGLSVSDLMIRVRNDVEKHTLYQQTPWDQSSLKAQFYFNPPDDVSEPQVEAAAEDVVMAAVPNDTGTAQRSVNTQIEAADPTLGFAILTPNETEAPAAPVITLPKAPVEVFGEEELIYAIQEELKRTGCYKDDVDGIWGRNSRDALTKYYETKKLRPTAFDPTRFHLDNLRAETGIVCVYVPPPPRKTPAVASKPKSKKNVGRSSTSSRPKATAKRSAPSKKAAPRRTASKPASKPAAAPAPKKKSLADAKLLGGFR